MDDQVSPRFDDFSQALDWAVENKHLWGMKDDEQLRRSFDGGV